MGIYYVSLLSTFVLMWLSRNIEIKKKERLDFTVKVLVIGFPLFIVSALRYNVGTDYPSYLHSFIVYKQNINDFVEPFYSFLCKAIIKLDLNEQWFFVITSFIVVYGILWFSLRESPLPALSVFLFWGLTYYFCSMNGVRQFTGIAILMLSLKYVEERNLLKFVFCVLLASCCHFSCFIFVLVYFLNNVTISPLKALIATAVIAIISNPITKLLWLLASYTRYGRYWGGVFDNGVGNYYRLAIHIAILLFCSVFYVKDRKFNLYYNLQILTVWVYIYSGKVAMIRRYAWTFGTASIILMAMAVNSIKDKRIRVLSEIAIVSLFFLYCVLSIKDGIQGCYPYQWIGGR